MLEMRPNCECCDRDLAADDPTVSICSFECTWCSDCVRDVLKGSCPNCGGELVARPTRARAKWASSPPSTVRVFNPECGGKVLAQV